MQLALAGTCAIIYIGLQLFLAMTNNTLTDSERNVLSSKLVLLAILPASLAIQAIHESGAST